MSAPAARRRHSSHVAVANIDPCGHKGAYLAERLTVVIEATYKALLAEGNPNHFVASDRIAIPAEVSLEEAQPASIFRLWVPDFPQEYIQAPIWRSEVGGLGVLVI